LGDKHAFAQMLDNRAVTLFGLAQHPLTIVQSRHVSNGSSKSFTTVGGDLPDDEFDRKYVPVFVPGFNRDNAVEHVGTSGFDVPAHAGFMGFGYGALDEPTQ
jgi:hypothetical protein